MHDADLTPRDQVADRLRRKDAEMRGHTAALLPWHQLTEPEQRRWGAMADEAFASIQSALDAAAVAGAS